MPLNLREAGIKNGLPILKPAYALYPKYLAEIGMADKTIYVRKVLRRVWERIKT
jgi:hypothetical protein